MASGILSKSRYLNGIQCPKLLWVQLHEPERVPETDPVTRYIFEQGNVVGELAKKLFPSGIDVPSGGFMDNIRQTKALFAQREPIFEAGILAGRIYSRIDILKPAGEDGWDIIEVKSSTGVKDVHIEDVAFQRYCCRQAGMNVRSCYLMYIDNQYVKAGEIEPEAMFIMQDISDEVEQLQAGIPDRVNELLNVISATECPEAAIGKHCKEPYECPLAECWDGLPEHNVFTLYYGGRKAYDLYRDGVVRIEDIPETLKLNGKQLIQRSCVVSGQPHIDIAGVRRFLGSLRYPLYYLDFETIGPAVPLFDGTRPYQNIPFQYSLHVVNREGSMTEPYSFLADGPDDPRPAFLAELSRSLGETGDIVVYNRGFEKGILEELGRAFPEYGGWVEQVTGRLTDLLEPFSKFHYYHPQQKGSASLKKVLPAVTGRDYTDLDIAEGQTASIAYETVTYNDVPDEVRNKVRADLEKYCGRDTEGMVWIVDGLRSLCG